MEPKNVLALCGSTRARSSNRRYLEAVERLAGPAWTVLSYEGLLLLPPFNPDVDPDHPPAPVQDLLQVLAAVDGIVICTPEYAMGVPGTLKNLIDWTVAASAFSQKPTALITASLGGHKGHAALMETLKVIEARMTEGTQMVISHAQTKINTESEITDPETLERVRTLVRAFDALMREAP